MIEKKLKMNIWKNRDNTKPSGNPAVVDSVRAFKTADGGLAVLCLDHHINRLTDSAKASGIEFTNTKAELREAVFGVLSDTPPADYYMTFELFQDGYLEIRNEHSPMLNTETHTIDSAYVRGYPHSEMQIKSPKHWFLWDNILIRDNHGYYVSGNKANLFIVKNYTLLTPPNNGSIVSGVTRGLIAEIFHESNFAKILINDITKSLPRYFAEKSLTRFDILTADEIFLTSTSQGIQPVISFNNQLISKGRTGLFTKILIDTYQNILRMKAPSHAAILEKIRP